MLCRRRDTTGEHAPLHCDSVTIRAAPAHLRLRCLSAVADLSDNLQAFLRTYIDSVEQLEVLLLLRASGRPWTVGEITRELATSAVSAASRLDSLAASQLVVRSGVGEHTTYEYRPVDEQVRRSVDELAETYPRRRVAIVTFIFTAPDESLRDFSNAFRLRKKGR